MQMQMGVSNRRLAGMLKVRLPEAALDDVADPRRRRLWSLGSLLRTVVVGVLAGMKSLAEVEAMSAEMSAESRRLLDIDDRVPDTTMRDILCTLDPEEVRGSLHALTRSAHRRKALAPERLPFGVVAMDGKVTALPSCDDQYAQRKTTEDGRLVGLLRTTTCTLVSSSAKVCIDAIPIDASTNEMGSFEASLASLVQAYRGLGLFKLVTYDAGACSIDNASAVRGHDLHYLFALKDSQPTLHAEARRLLGSLDATQAAAGSEDVTGAGTVYRRVYLTEEMAGFLDWEHLYTVLRVESETTDRGGKRLAHESRYFISSLPRSALGDAQWLRVVRLHWAVENNCHNTFDTVFEEDDRPWIEASPRGALVVALLRRTAYDMLALFRSVTLRSAEHRAMPWRDLLRWMRNALISTTAEQLDGLRVRDPPSPLAIAA
jgi:hypothetical protein